jgi:SAM-dependent methyltransferase
MKKRGLGGNTIGGDPQSFTPLVWDWLINRFSVKSMLDVGCGDGTELIYFKQKKIKTFGIDGLRANIFFASNKGLDCCAFNLATGAYFHSEKVDLILCVEVVEHIEEKYFDNILKTFTNGRILAMTHALPHQRGYHHVNCQADEYWITKLESSGFIYLKDLTVLARKIAEKNSYFSKSGLLFENINKDVLNEI